MKPLRFLILSGLLALVCGCIEDPQFKPAEIGVSTSEISFEKESGEYVLNLYSNRDWEVEVSSTSGDTDWLALSDTCGVASSDSVVVTISVLQNTGEDRYATVTFNTGTVYASVRISQVGELQKQYTSISDVRAMYSGSNVTVPDGTTIKATVISNYRNSDYGGLNNATSAKTMVVSDETAGISLFLTENNTVYAPGDVLELKLDGLELQRYNNGSLQVNAMPLANINLLTTGATVEPVEITAAQLCSGDFESQYVAVADVQVTSSDIGKTFVQDENHTSINFESKTGERFVLFSSRYSTFGDEQVPSGSGVLKGIAMVYGNTYQMSITALSDYEGLTGERFESGSGGGDDGELKEVTIAEFLEAPVDGSTWYKLTGTITDITNTQFGNFDIKDETDTVFVWGLTSTKQDGNDKSFSSLGLEVGDVLTFATLRSEHNGEAQGGGKIPAYYISHEDGEGGGSDPGTGDLIEGNVDITSNISSGTSCSEYTVTLASDGTQYAGLKIGTSTKAGNYTTPSLPKQGTMKLSMYAVAWNNKDCKLTITVNNGGTINGSSSTQVDLISCADTYNTTDAGTLNITTNDYYEFDLADITSSSTLTFSTSTDTGTRTVMFYVNVE